MKKLILPIFFFISQASFAQYTETITSSRPGQAITPLTVGRNVFQIQSGLNIYGLKERTIFAVNENGVNYSALARYGIHERIELRTLIGISRSNLDVADTSDPRFSGFELEQSRFNGFSSFSLGTKFKIINGEGMKPNLAFQADFQLPVVDEDFRREKVATTLIMTYSQGLTDRLGMTANFGLNWDGNRPHDAIGLYVLNFGFAITDKLSTFIETYGAIVEEDEHKISFDTGFAYLINNNLLIDISGGFGNNHGIKEYFIDFGASWRTKFGRNKKD